MGLGSFVGFDCFFDVQRLNGEMESKKAIWQVFYVMNYCFYCYIFSSRGNFLRIVIKVSGKYIIVMWSGRHEIKKYVIYARILIKF